MIPDDRALVLKAMIRDVPDFPKPGIVFKDITPMLADARCLGLSIDLLSEPWIGKGVTHVLAIESRGFIFGAAVAARLGVGFVPIRKPGKLPSAASRVSYDLEYGSDAIEMHVDAVNRSSRVILVDDLIATGGTAAAAVELARGSGAIVMGASFVIELAFLEGRARKLRGIQSNSLIVY
ncbi:MAG: adenine phosphoribosyltransferase [Deltaproteobacteria bacterium]|nr:adenine phosphoribosyltransferase [Deltaproteobacteria bacterium]